MTRNRMGIIGAWVAALGLTVGLIVAVAWPSGAAGQSKQQASAIQGDYTVTIVKDDVPTGVAAGPTAIGQWRISFKPNGTYELARLDVGTVVTGTYKVSGNKVTITDASGILSCANPQAGNGVQAATGTYTWSVKSDKLTLTASQDGCAIRKIILATRTLGVYVPCVTTPLAALAGTSASTPVPATPSASFFAKAPTPAAATAADGIDNLLKQVTACWSTGDPARLLPLFSNDLLTAIVKQTGTVQDVAGVIQPLMTLPFTWERAGDVQRTGANSASAVVRITLQDHEDFQRFNFVLENGVWKVDTFILTPQDIPGAVPTATAGA